MGSSGFTSDWRKGQSFSSSTKHYHMSSAQFRRCDSELCLLEGVKHLFDSIVRDCEICLKTKPAPPRSRFSGVRAKNFGDVVFMDHCEIKHMSKRRQLFLALDGATSLLGELPKKPKWEYPCCEEWSWRQAARLTDHADLELTKPDPQLICQGMPLCAQLIIPVRALELPLPFHKVVNKAIFIT